MKYLSLSSKTVDRLLIAVPIASAVLLVLALVNAFVLPSGWWRGGSDHKALVEQCKVIRAANESWTSTAIQIKEGVAAAANASFTKADVPAERVKAAESLKATVSVECDSASDEQLTKYIEDSRKFVADSQSLLDWYNVEIQKWMQKFYTDNSQKLAGIKKALQDHSDLNVKSAANLPELEKAVMTEDFNEAVKLNSQLDAILDNINQALKAKGDADRAKPDTTVKPKPRAARPVRPRHAAAKPKPAAPSPTPSEAKKTLTPKPKPAAPSPTPSETKNTLTSKPEAKPEAKPEIKPGNSANEGSSGGTSTSNGAGGGTNSGASSGASSSGGN